jgi:hypothetical protein
MAIISDDADNYNDYDYEYDPYNNYDDDAELHDSDGEYIADRDSGDIGSINSATEMWRQLRINETVICVSSRGRVKAFGSLFNPASEGVQHLGTPYRTYRVGQQVFYIHELVWWAFNGPIAPGYQILHNSHYVNRRSHISYSNNLECLTIQKIHVSSLQSSLGVAHICI